MFVLDKTKITFDTIKSDEVKDVLRSMIVKFYTTYPQLNTDPIDIQKTKIAALGFIVGESLEFDKEVFDLDFDEIKMMVNMITAYIGRELNEIFAFDTSYFNSIVQTIIKFRYNIIFKVKIIILTFTASKNNLLGLPGDVVSNIWKNEAMFKKVYRTLK